MEHHFYPPFFEIAPESSFHEAWEAFCCQLLNLVHGTTEIRRRKPPDMGVDLHWPSARIAYQCKAVESGQSSSFPLAKTISSLKTALDNRASIGWDKYVVCTNVDLTGHHEEKLKEVYRDVEIDSPSYWRPACQRYQSFLAGRFRLLVRVAEPALVRAIDEIFLESYASKLRQSLAAEPITLLVYSNRRREIFEVPASLDFSVENLLDLLMSVFRLPKRHVYDDHGVSVSLSYSLVINEKKVSLNRTLRELGIQDRSLVTFWTTIRYRDQHGSTEAFVMELSTMESMTRRSRSPAERANAAIKEFEGEIERAFQAAIDALP